MAKKDRGAIRLALTMLVAALISPLLFVPPAMAAGPKLPHATPAPPPIPQQDLDRLIAAFPEGLTLAQIDAVAASASESTARAALHNELVQRLAERPAGVPQETALEFYARRLDDIERGYGVLLGELAAGPLAEGAAPPRGVGRLVIVLLATIGLACLAAFLAHRALARRGDLMQEVSPPWARLQRLVADMATLVTFCAVVVAIYLIMRPHDQAAPHILMAVLRLGLFVGIIFALCRLLFAPGRSDLRPVAVSDEVAHALQRSIVVLITLVVLPSTVFGILSARAAEPDAVLGISLPLTVLPLAYILWLLARHHRALVRELANSLGLDPGRAPYLRLVAPALGVYLIAIWLLTVDAQLRGQPDVMAKAIASLVLALLVPLAARWARLGLERFYAAADTPRTVADGDWALAPAHADDRVVLIRPTGDPAETSAAHVTRLMRAVWAVLAVTAVLPAAFLWGFNPSELGIADLLMRLLLNVGVILLLGYVGWALFQRWVDRRIELARSDADETRAQRLQTLLPLFRAFVRVSLVAVLAMIVLSSLGIEIGPLLAGAGVVGIAIGLGAQQTIADILAGVFFLLEDSFRMGDYVEVGNIRGTVEGISLRSLKLRHQRGAVHTLPFGQIKALTNDTRDWSLMRLEFRLAPDTDTDLVKRIVKTIGKDLAADPEFGSDFIGPIKSQGVRNVEGNAIVVGIKYITKPGKQFSIRREAYKRIIAAFRQNGIELSSPNVVVRVENTKGAPDTVVGAAAHAALSAAKPAA